jgi:hypothetical protein
MYALYRSGNCQISMIPEMTSSGCKQHHSRFTMMYPCIRFIQRVCIRDLSNQYLTSSVSRPSVYLSCLASICSPSSTYLSSACFCVVFASTTSFHLLYLALPCVLVSHHPHNPKPSAKRLHPTPPVFGWEIRRRWAWRDGRTARSNMPGFFAALKSLPSATFAYAYS